MLLSLLNARVMNAPRLTIPNARNMLDARGRLALGESQRFLTEQADAYLRFLRRVQAMNAAE
jgi:hypothetical protein